MELPRGRGAYPFSRELCVELDLVHVNFRKRHVLEDQLLETSIYGRGRVAANIRHKLHGLRRSGGA